MARLQILELPEGTGDDRPPFVLVVDQYEPPPYPNEPSDTSPFDGIAERIGARAVLVFEDTIDIPANEVPVGPDGYPVRVHVEGDFERFREQVREEIAKAQAEVADALRQGLR